jgi:hypothetical protein
VTAMGPKVEATGVRGAATMKEGAKFYSKEIEDIQDL